MTQYMMREPVSFEKVLAGFTDLWSPHIVTQFNGYDVRVAKFHGEYIWHSHDDNDELFIVLAGTLVIHLREAGVERSVTLEQGSTFVVPCGVEHKPVSLQESHILMIDPTGTLSVGNAREPIPDHIDATTGHPIT